MVFPVHFRLREFQNFYLKLSITSAVAELNLKRRPWDKKNQATANYLGDQSVFDLLGGKTPARIVTVRTIVSLEALGYEAMTG